MRTKDCRRCDQRRSIKRDQYSFLIMLDPMLKGQNEEDITMTCFMSKRNREKFVHDGHMYTFDKLDCSQTIKFWRCDKRDSYGCTARLHTSVATNEVVKQVNAHSHVADVGRVEVAALCTAVKLRARETADTPSAILSKALQSMSTAAKGRIPNMDAMRKLIQRRRRTTEVAPSQDLTVASVVVPTRCRTYGAREHFLIYDSGLGDQQRILIFGRESNSSWSSEIKSLYADGTFGIEPPLFAKMYVLMADRRGFVVPVLYALLPNRQEATYRRMFQAIKDRLPQLAPDSICMDFEKAAMNAARVLFPAADVFGGFSHLLANIRRKLTEQGLMETYRSDQAFALNVRMLASLAFVPLDALSNAFDELAIQSPQALDPLLDWFERFYVGCPNRFGGRRIPLFPPAMWSLHRRTRMGRDLAKDFVEAAHRHIGAEFDVSRPTLQRLVEGIRKAQVERERQYEEYLRSEEPPSKRLRFAQAEQRFRRIVEQFDSGSTMDYLRGIARSFELADR